MGVVLIAIGIGLAVVGGTSYDKKRPWRTPKSYPLMFWGITVFLLGLIWFLAKNVV